MYTFEDVKNYIEVESNSNYKLITSKEDYVNTSTKIFLKCENGHMYDVQFKKFKIGKRCRFCKGGVKLTYQEVKSQIEFNDGYKLVSTEYKNNSTPIEIQCPNNHVYKTTWQSYQQGKRCNLCISNRPYSYLEIKESVIENGYVLLTEEKDYVNANTSIVTCCPNKHTYTTTFTRFSKGVRCGECVGGIRLEYKDVKQIVEADKYELVSTTYTNNTEKLTMQCDKGHRFEMNMSNFNQGNRCPTCCSSKGEKRIRDYLISKNIKFSEQYRIKDCKNIRPLPFDFAILNEDSTLNCLIEYDGRQHFEVANCFGGIDAFNTTKINDEIKNNYCFENEIRLIRIPYTDFNVINSILDSIDLL
jgi:hypothetical protein